MKRLTAGRVHSAEAAVQLIGVDLERNRLMPLAVLRPTADVSLHKFGDADSTR